MFEFVYQSIKNKNRAEQINKQSDNENPDIRYKEFDYIGGAYFLNEAIKQIQQEQRRLEGDVLNIDVKIKELLLQKSLREHEIKNTQKTIDELMALEEKIEIDKAKGNGDVNE